jgi:hypothetical protein
VTPGDDIAIIETMLRSDLAWLFSGDIYAWFSALFYAT